MKSALGWLASAAAGATLWVTANLVEGTQEPWDSEAYWTIYLPLAGLLCFGLGFGFPERPWRWPLAVMFAQLPVMMAFTGEIGVFIVLGVGILLFLSLFGMALAWLGAAFRRSPRQGRAT